jgi:hypothetical protein
MSQVGNRVINNKAVRNLMTFAVPRDVEPLCRRPRCDRDACVGGLHHKDTHVVGSKTMWARHAT